MIRDALVVGINKYNYHSLQNLTAPAQDAEDIAQILEKYGDFKVRRLPEVKDRQHNTIRVGQKTDVKLTDLEEAIVKLFKPEGKNIPDTALLYFSGHGLRKNKGFSEGFLATSDSDPDSGKWGLLLQSLCKLLQESEVKQQIIWLDCCYSGEFLNLEEANPGDKSKARDRCFIVASREFEEAYEAIDSHHSVLTDILLQGLDPKKHFGKWVNNYTLIDFIAQNLKDFPQRPIFYNYGHEINLTHTWERPNIEFGNLNQENREIAEQSKIILSLQLAAKSDELLNQSRVIGNLQPNLISHSLLLAVESVKRYYCLETDKALRQGIAILARPIATMNYESDNSRVKAIAFSQDGKYLAAACHDNIARIWKWSDTNNNNCQLLKHNRQLVSREDRKGQYLKIEGFELYKIFYAKNYLFTITRESTENEGFRYEYSIISVWDLSSEQIISSQTIAKIIDCQFILDSESLLTLLDHPQPNITILWKCVNGRLQPINIFSHAKRTIACALSPDSKSLVISDEIQEKTWQTGSGEGSKYISQKYVSIIAFSPDGKYMAKVSQEHSTDEYLTVVSELANGHIVSNISHKYLVWAISFSPDGRYLAIAGRSRIAHICEVNTGKEVACIPHENFVYDIVFSPTCNGSYLLATASKVAQVWELDHAPQVTLITHRAEKIPVKSNTFQGAVFSPDSKYIATADDDGTLKIWATANSQSIACLQYDSPVRIFTFSPDGGYIATVSKDNTICIRDWQDSSNQALMQVNYKEFIRSIIFSPDGKYLAILIAAPNHQNFWEVRVLLLNFRLSDLQLSQNVNSLVWEELNRQEFRTVPCGGTSDVKFSWDGKDLYLVTASSDGTARIWNVVTSAKMAEVSHETLEPK